MFCFRFDMASSRFGRSGRAPSGAEALIQCPEIEYPAGLGHHTGDADLNCPDPISIHKLSTPQQTSFTSMTRSRARRGAVATRKVKSRLPVVASSPKTGIVAAASSKISEST
jgi:hypothetical protein